jgi:hypothetical protein
MSWEKLVKQITNDAIKAAKNYKVNESSVDYKAGYVKGVRSLANLVRLTQSVAAEIAKEEEGSPGSKVLMGYVASLQILLDSADAIIPPEYEMQP